MRQGIALATSVVTLVGMWMAGSHNWKGWALGIFNQVLWFWFIVAFDAWGLLPLNIALVFVYGRNLLRWKNEQIIVREESDAE